MATDVSKRPGRVAVGVFWILWLAAQAPPTAAGDVEQAQPYTIGPQDVLAVTVFNQPELTGTFEVGTDGAVTLPLIGRLDVAGLTLRDFEATLTQKLAANILRNPQVSAAVETYRSQRFFVIGEVRQPGAYYLSGHETLLQAIARAGYTTADAGSEVLLVRPRQGSADAGPVRPDQVDAGDVQRVDLDGLTTGRIDHNPAVRDGDTILVTRAETVYILGQVKAPGAFRLSRGMTVAQLISMAGGVTDRGSTGRIKVTRLVNGKKQDLKIAIGDTVLPNDTITVLEKWF
jgi:polysaccharide export outer membrane protein